MKQELKQENDFSLTIAEPKLFIESIKAISDLISEVKFRVRKKSIGFLEIDPANVTLVKYELLRNSCVEWDYIEDFDFSVNLNDLTNIFKTFKENDTLKLRVNIEEKKAELELIGDIIKEVKIDLLDNDNLNEQKMPDLEFGAKVILESRSFRNAIINASHFKDSVDFEILDNQFLLSKDNFKVKIEVEGLNKSDIKSTYSSEYLKYISRASNFSKFVLIEYSNDYPSKLTFEVKDKLIVEYILAPRVEN